MNYKLNINKKQSILRFYKHIQNKKINNINKFVK